MTSQRAEAYGRVMKTLADLSASKFHGNEESTIREAAESLLFSDDLAGDEAATDALSAAADLCALLVSSDRLVPETAERLLTELEACGPFVVPDALPVAEPVA